MYNYLESHTFNIKIYKIIIIVKNELSRVFKVSILLQNQNKEFVSIKVFFIDLLIHIRDDVKEYNITRKVFFHKQKQTNKQYIV